MIKAYPIRPAQVREVPQRFSWIDQRLVREHHIEEGSSDSWRLYLFLVTVSDAKGLSYYSDQTLCRLFSWQYSQLQNSRQELLSRELIAYKMPVYQVLDLGKRNLRTEREPRERGKDTMSSVADILKGMLNKTPGKP